MTKRPTPTSGFKFRGEAETGCGKALTVIGAVVIVVCAVAIVLYLTHIFGMWPDWAIEFELLVKAAWKAWMR